MFAEKFSEKVRARLEHMRMSHVEAATSIGMRTTAFSDMLRLNRPPSKDPQRIFQLAQVLGVGMDYLLDDSIPVGEMPGPTAAEMRILDMVRKIGLEEAERRLLMVPSAAGFDRTWGGDLLEPGQGGSRRGGA